ncbi:GNAT family N-acetyltransferase [Georgenia sp. SYP-B2076]|uniref:GNAT family N-acetyltransferase n=1 Tax=Georgenia sp. SYP-B2076 TaxID=2495881 RepID=UPI000F8EF2A8|nr:GNAT family N-acetyltransferase [Georgenia sp. SYP-B2076]
MQIAPRPADDPALARLLAAAVDELNVRYPEEPTEHALDPRAEFLLADVDGHAAGCVALVPVDPGAAEIKRVFVDPAFRGRGVASALLARLEALAHERKIATLLLETGVRQPESVALYEKLGYMPIESYGPHVGSTLSLCYAKEL